MAYLKDEIPADIAEILRQAEARADECWRALHLRHYPADLAIWAVLTGGIRMVEGEQATRGSNTPRFDAMLANLSRLLAVAVKWAIGHGQPPADAPRRWTGELSAAVDQALALAKDYAHLVLRRADCDLCGARPSLLFCRRGRMAFIRSNQR
jgi:hypothetical protein